MADRPVGAADDRRDLAPASGVKSKPSPPASRAACARSSSLTSMSPENARVTAGGPVGAGAWRRARRRAAPASVPRSSSARSASVAARPNTRRRRGRPTPRRSPVGSAQRDSLPRPPRPGHPPRAPARHQAAGRREAVGARRRRVRRPRGRGGWPGGSRRGTRPGRRRAGSRPPRITPARSLPRPGSWSDGRPRTSTTALRARVAIRQAASSAAASSGASRPASRAAAQRRQRPGGAQRRHLGAVPQLQQLHGPLDVDQPAAAELGVRGRVGAAGQPLGVHPRLEPADLGGRRRRQPAGRVAQRVGQLDERRRPAPGRRPSGGPAAAPAPPTASDHRGSTPGRTPGCGPAARCALRPQRPRRPAAAGPAAGSASSRRSSATTAFAAAAAPRSPASGSGSCTNSASTSEP